MFDRLTERLSQAVNALSGRGRITEDNIAETVRQVRMALLEADVALPVVKDFTEQVRVRALGADFVVGPGTEEGNTVLARAAARDGLPFAANCTVVTPGSPVTVTRSRWGGSLLEQAAIHADRAFLTVAAHVFEAAQTGGSASVVACACDQESSIT